MQMVTTLLMCRFLASTVPQIAAPEITVSVIDNNVLLYWTEPASLFKIDYYTVDKTGDAEAAGRVDGTFTSLFEVVAGTYNYAVAAIDISTNVGRSAEIQAEVNTPPDYALQDTRVSGLNRTRDNVLRIPIRPSLSLLLGRSTDLENTFKSRIRLLTSKRRWTLDYPIYIQSNGAKWMV
jgi:hypothetical protein